MSLGAAVGEGKPIRDVVVLSERDDLAPRLAHPQLGGGRVQGHQAEVGLAVEQVAAAVVEHEQEPPRQLGQVRRGNQGAVQLGRHRAQIGHAAGDPGQGGAQHVADPVVGRRGQQPERGDGGQHRGGHGVAQPADLQPPA